MTLAEVWNERLGSRDGVDLAIEPTVCAEAAAAFSPVGFTVRFEEGSYLARVPNGFQLVVQASLLPEESGYEDVEGGAISREVNTAAKTAEHVQLYIPPRWQGDRRSRARKLTQASVALYDALAIDYVIANTEGVGRYAWATCGFDFYDHHERRATIELAEQLAARLGRPRDLTAIHHSWEIAALEVTSDEDPVTLGELAKASGVAAPPKETEQIPFGKALLLGPASTGWVGLLDLRSKSAGRAVLMS
ncbi:MAG: hypothetical protein WKF41_12865 [Gaiellaceae bacterium]